VAPGKRRWTLPGARALLPDVRERTALAVAEVQALLDRRDREGSTDASTEQLDALVAKVTSGWVRAMEAFGLEVKGLWLIDFDSGSGCYCWRWPEPELSYFHGYDEGFVGRVRIQ
jgi:hypothetical protein